MAQDLPIYQRQLTLPQRINEVQLTDAPNQLMRKQADIMAETGAKIEERALNNSYLAAQTTMTQELNRMELQNQNDPDAMKKAIGNWSGKFLQDVYDPEIKARLELQLTEHSQAAIARGIERRNRAITEQGQYQTYLAMDGLGDEIDNTAQDLFSADPVVKISAGRRMQELMVRSQKILGQTGPDGTPLVSPEARASRLFAARDGSFESMGRAWIQTQPDKLKAAQDWVDGKVTIDMPNTDGTATSINLRDSMPETAKKKADDAIMGLVRDNIALENQRNTLKDRQDQKDAENGITQLTLQLQQDPASVSVDQLDLNSNLFIRGGKSKEYLALRSHLLEGDPIAEDGNIKRSVLGSALRGQNPDNIGLQALEDKKISYETLTKARVIYQQSQGPADNTLSFYSKQFQTAYGGVNKVLEGTQAEALANGQIMLTSQYAKMTGELKRAPTMQEFEPVYRNVLRAMSTVNNQEVTLGSSTAIAPSFIPPGELSGPKSPEQYARLQAAVLNNFKVELGANPQEWPKDDAGLLAARRFLKMYEVEMQKQNAVKTGTGVE